MPTSTKTLSTAALDVLRAAVISDNTVDLAAAGQLPRPLYAEVKAALTRLGGTWSRTRRVHVFDHNPRLALLGLLDLSEAPPAAPSTGVA